MFKYLICGLLVTMSHQIQAKDYAIATNRDGSFMVLTYEVCRYDKTLPEAYGKNAKGEKVYACYWFGIKRVYFDNPKQTIKPVFKNEFELIDGIV